MGQDVLKRLQALLRILYIVTGSLNTIAPGQYIFIESTAEGREGYFYEMCRKAQA